MRLFNLYLGYLKFRMQLLGHLEQISSHLDLFYGRIKKKMRGNKYGSKRTEKAGIWFDSKAESRFHDELLLRERAGEIEILALQDRVSLSSKVSLRVDFKVLDKILNEVVWEEFKGLETDVWKIKRNLWFDFGPGRLRVYRENRKGIYLHEEIIPQMKAV